jgi:hypothetical protein
VPLFIHLGDVRRLFPVWRVLALLAPKQYQPWCRNYDKGPCPICTRSRKNTWFRYTAERWQCLRCKRSGDCIDLAAWLIREWGRHPAVALCARAGVAAPTFDEPIRLYKEWVPLETGEATGY